MGIILETQQKEKLARYMRNANRFLWGLIGLNQKEAYSWLQGEKYEFSKGPYAWVLDQLIKKYGVERITDQLIISRVNKLFTPPVLVFLRDCWVNGRIPEINELKRFNTANWRPFIEVNGQSQYQYVEGWGQFAGVWFEEIEPYQESE